MVYFNINCFDRMFVAEKCKQDNIRTESHTFTFQLVFDLANSDGLSRTKIANANIALHITAFCSI